MPAEPPSKRYSRLIRWSRNGALIGFLVAISDFFEWRGEKFAPWSGEGIAFNISIIGGSTIFAAAIGAVAALIANRSAK